MKKETRVSPDKERQLLILGLLLSLSVGMYLFFATVGGRTISISFGIIFFGAILLFFRRNRIGVLVGVNNIYNLAIFLYFFLTTPNTSEIRTSAQGCMDICLGEAVIFHFVKTYSVLSISVAMFLSLAWVRKKWTLPESTYWIMIGLITLLSAITFIIFWLTF